MCSTAICRVIVRFIVRECREYGIQKLQFPAVQELIVNLVRRHTSQVIVAWCDKCCSGGVDKWLRQRGGWHGPKCLGEQEGEMLEGVMLALRPEEYVDVLGKEKLKMVHAVNSTGFLDCSLPVFL